ncbi:hypothetical protein AJ80_08769 [Polytolypa hystricis UAMH7299]|uniref:RING-type domain-containing protein n=1 Tax=Polytolypa hystricis (strain UAMH7299) TaxID=1447883 RepID=A0A2B7X2R5_POLH7|nr:hypothetical protein AJ80_08769 [Polytolypa hystricis UAMH7299]
MPPSTATAAAAAATTTAANQGGSPANSPLLFFVALGFGVVFTNLWIIVGVKYCFRYNQRNRQARNEEAAEAIDLANVPRPHRRRREKKLMTMDEVNDRFPLVKYKAWRATRADQGLPTAGGIQSPESRPQSLKNEDATIAVSASGAISPPASPTRTINPQSSSDAPEAEQSTATHKNDQTPTDGKTEPVEKPTAARTENTANDDSKQLPTIATTQDPTSPVDDDDDGYDHIRTAIPTELLGNPGDSCAICLDIIEDDDDVRGLACGHAFHASCLDPWLTSRRACCPLCKADYYVPKARPEGQDGAHQAGVNRRAANSNGPAPPNAAYLRNRTFTSRLLLPGRFVAVAHPQEQNGSRTMAHDHRSNRRPQAVRTNRNNEGTNGNEPGSWRARLPTIRMPQPSLPRFNLFNGRNRPSSTTTQGSPTPRQLESGSS